MAAIPVSSLLGSPISGLMLKLNWADLPGWRWIFIIQGLVPVLAGFVTLFFLPNRPENASWLQPEEKEWLIGELAAGAAGKTHGHWEWLGQAGTVLLMTAFYFGLNVSSYGLVTFMPKILQSQLSQADAPAIIVSSIGQCAGLANPWQVGLTAETMHRVSTPRMSDTAVSILAGLPYLMGLIAMLLNGWHSDRTGERIWHASVPLLCLSGSIFLAACLDGWGLAPVFVMIFLVGTFMYAHLPAFWPIPSMFLGAAAAASAIGFINMIGNVGSFVGPAMMGGYAAQNNIKGGLMFLSLFPLASATIILIVGWMRRHSLRRITESKQP
jgi:ACS family tartrate transporter-like MFS transporter